MLQLNKRKLIVSMTIGMVASIGDINVHGVENRLGAAVVDNVTHAAIGFLTWVGVLCADPSFKFKSSFIEFFFCALSSSLIDVDHFIKAKSFHLKDAISINNRPFLHCTSSTLSAIFVILIFAFKFNIFWLYQFGWILMAAILSHHVRDSSRRGFWMWPFGSTPPTQYGLYIAFQMFLPYVISYLMNQFQLTTTKLLIDETIELV